MERTWDEFIDAPADLLDQSRRGKVARITRRRDGDVLLNPRTMPGPEVALSVPVARLEAERRRMGETLSEGRAVAITRWGVVDGILWSERAEEAWKGKQ